MTIHSRVLCSEHCPVQDVYISGLHRIEPVGNFNDRYIFYIEDRAPDGSTIHAHRLSIIMPREALGEALAKAMKVLANASLEEASRTH